MTDEEKRELAIRIIDESIPGKERIIEKAKLEGTWKPGLDGNCEELDKFEEDLKNRLKEIERM